MYRYIDPPPILLSFKLFFYVVHLFFFYILLFCAYGVWCLEFPASCEEEEEESISVKQWETLGYKFGGTAGVCPPNGKCCLRSLWCFHKKMVGKEKRD